MIVYIEEMSPVITVYAMGQSQMIRPKKGLSYEIP